MTKKNKKRLHVFTISLGYKLGILLYVYGWVGG